MSDIAESTAHSPEEALSSLPDVCERKRSRAQKSRMVVFLTYGQQAYVSMALHSSFLEPGWRAPRIAVS